VDTLRIVYRACWDLSAWGAWLLTGGAVVALVPLPYINVPFDAAVAGLGLALMRQSTSPSPGAICGACGCETHRLRGCRCPYSLEYVEGAFSEVRAHYKRKGAAVRGLSSP
jgi:hypothetical protein